ncbi:MAG: hypothetical protein R3F56_07695 [Planctomycetota bacterium]
MRSRSNLLRALGLAGLAAACAAPRMPDGSGRGLLSHDRTPPDGVETFQAPRWQNGDRLVYLRGDALRLTTHVEVTEAGYDLVDEATGERQALTTTLGDRGELAPDPRGGQPRPVIEQAPADERYHWPLWVGKRWSCHFLRKAPGQPPLPLLVTYVVEDVDEVTVPAGTFRALRIVRRANVAAEGTYLGRVAVSWYAPEAGVEVRRIDDGVLTELAELHRQ